MLRLTRAVLIAAALFVWAAPAVRADETPSIDPNHTSAHFAAKHLLISTVQGDIPVKSVKVTLAADNIPTSVEATLDLTKIDTHNDQRDSDLRSDKFLNVQQFPEMTFKSTKIVPQSGGNFVMNGELTIHGVTKPVSVNGNVVGSVKDGRGRTHVGYAASVTLDRTQWGIGAGVPPEVVGTNINVTIEAEAIL
jgi:polyisoprenoid-binding protein YceI